MLASVICVNRKVLLLDTLRQALKTASFGDKIRVVLETLLDTPYTSLILASEDMMLEVFRIVTPTV